MPIYEKPATLRTSRLKEVVKVRFLSAHLRRFPRDQSTLDIGCGWGFSLKINPEFWLVDADKDCIEYLKAQGAKASHADVSGRLPFDDSSFDNAFTHDVLEHLEEQEMLNLFQEARRVLKKGGLFMNVVPNRRGYTLGLSPSVGHKRFVQVPEIQSAARATGFELMESWHTPLPKFLSELFVHNKLVVVCRAI